MLSSVVGCLPLISLKIGRSLAGRSGSKFRLGLSGLLQILISILSLFLLFTHPFATPVSFSSAAVPCFGLVAGSRDKTERMGQTLRPLTSVHWGSNFVPRKARLHRRMKRRPRGAAEAKSVAGSLWSLHNRKEEHQAESRYAHPHTHPAREPRSLKRCCMGPVPVELGAVLFVIYF